MSKANLPVLVISSLGELCTDRVIEKLRERDVPVLRLNYEEVTLDTRFSVSINGAGSQIAIEHNGESYSSFRSVWFRRWGYPIYPAAFDEVSIAFGFNEFTSLIHGLPFAAEAYWLNNPRYERMAANKVRQLCLASELGMRIPATRVTNDSYAIQEIRLLGSNVVFKPVSGTSIPLRLKNYAAEAVLAERGNFNYGVNATCFDIFTQQLSPEHEADLRSLTYAPVIFQEHIEKDYEVRATVVGKKIFAAKIFSQERHETAIDFRKMNKSGVVRHEAIELPQHLCLAILEMMRDLNIVFGCFDFAVDKRTGDFVFFEVNPSGQWLWIEDLTGLEISKAIADILAQPSPEVFF